jgi:hypothetical protein
MHKILLSSLGLLGLAAVAVPAASDAEARTAADITAATSRGPSLVQVAPTAVERGVAAEDDSAARRKRRRHTRR